MTEFATRRLELGGTDGRTTCSTSIASDVGDQIESATLGTDVEGHEHHYIRSADAVVVIDATGAVDHVEWLRGRPLNDWRKFVASERGWERMGPWAPPLLEADARRKGAGR